MSESAARITLSANGLIMKIVGNVLIIETSDPDELRREVNRALGDEPLTVQGAAGYLKVSTRTIRNWIKDGKLPAKQFNGSGYRIQKRDLEQIQTDILSPAIYGLNDVCGKSLRNGSRQRCEGIGSVIPNHRSPSSKCLTSQ